MACGITKGESPLVKIPPLYPRGSDYIIISFLHPATRSKDWPYCAWERNVWRVVVEDMLMHFSRRLPHHRRCCAAQAAHVLRNTVDD